MRNKTSPPDQNNIDLIDSVNTANAKIFAKRYGASLMQVMETFKQIANECDFDSYSMMLYSIGVAATEARHRMDETTALMKCNAPTA